MPVTGQVEMDPRARVSRLPVGFINPSQHHTVTGFSATPGPSQQI
ncbi:hypothetical protein D3OALGB2SA_146 [Olavius algarvensis associated proteobacterium Delta 3]|nr:hypothetical protein D3OALGB2SA_146 [Olavius algarvensis associated proteobacterium Delta 3]